MRTLVVAFALAAAVLAASAGAAPKDACGLLSKAEVTAAIGEPLKSVQGGHSATGAVFCNWTGKDSHLLSRGISIIAATDNAAQRYKGYLALLKSTKPVAGIGVAAVTDGTLIVARSANAFVMVSPLTKGTGVTLPTIVALTKKALARAK